MTIVLNGTTGITSPSLDALDIELNNINVVERGSNANGDYTRFGDGTQICKAILSSGSTDFTWTFPAAFSVKPATYAQTENASVAVPTVVHVCQAGIATPTTLTINKLYLTYPTPGNFLDAAGEDVAFIAVGRWF